MKNILSIKSVLATVSLSALLLTTACSGMNERLSRIGQPPQMNGIQTAQNAPGGTIVNLPMPPQEVANTNANSLWQPSRQTFFKDQRANKAGDILTVIVDIEDEADWKNKTERTRTGNESLGVPNLLGLESLPAKVLPGGYDPENLATVKSGSTSVGDGKMKREETVTTKLAAIVTQVLPNGNFVIRGQQEVRVNNDLRELTLDGIIRPEDIMNNNSISYEKIAEARISYGGRGQVMDIQQPRYGQQVYDAIMPF